MLRSFEAAFIVGLMTQFLSGLRPNFVIGPLLLTGFVRTQLLRKRPFKRFTQTTLKRPFNFLLQPLLLPPVQTLSRRLKRFILVPPSSPSPSP